LTAVHKKKRKERRRAIEKSTEAGPNLAERIETWLSPWRVVGLLAVFALIYTFPLPFNLSGAVLGKFKNYYGDIFEGLWEFWNSKYLLLDLKTNPFRYETLAGPYSSSWLSPLAAHKYPVLMVPLTALVGPVASMNLFVLSGFVLAGFFTYLIVRRLTGGELPGLAAGLIFAFCPYAWARSIIHLDLAAYWPLPFLVWSLLLFDRYRTWGKAFLVLVALVAFHIFCSPYYYLFIPLLFGSYLVVRFVDAFIYDFEKGELKRGSFSRLSTKQWVGVGIGAVVLIAGAVVLYEYYLSREASAMVRPLHWQERFKLSWANYLLPGVDHPLFGRFTRSVVPIRRNVTESTAYLGWVGIILALVGTRRAAGKWQTWMFLLLGLASLSFTLGPYITVGDFRIPMPSLLLHRLAPFIRAIGRYTIFVQLCLAVLAGFGLVAVIQRWGRRTFFNQVFALAFLLAAVEYLHPLEITPVATKPENAPPVYARIAALEPDITLFEYPATAASGLALGDYLYFQSIHKKRLFNRQYDTTTIPEEYLPFWKDLDYPGALSDPNNVALLSYFGVDYVAFHDRRGTATVSLPTLDLSEVEGLELVEDFGKAALYRVVAEPATVLLSFDTRPYYNYLELQQQAQEYDFYPPLVIGSGSQRLGWRIMQQKGRLRLLNLLDVPQKVVLEAQAFSFATAREVEIFSRGQSLGRLSLGKGAQQITIGPLELPPQAAVELVLSSVQEASQIQTGRGTISASIALARMRVRRLE